MQVGAPGEGGQGVCGEEEGGGGSFLLGARQGEGEQGVIKKHSNTHSIIFNSQVSQISSSVPFKT